MLTLDLTENPVVAGVIDDFVSGDFFVAKYTPAGALVFDQVQSFGAASDSFIFSMLTVDSQNNIVISGQKTLYYQGLSLVTQKYNSSGALLWSNEYIPTPPVGNTTLGVYVPQYFEYAGVPTKQGVPGAIDAEDNIWTACSNFSVDASYSNIKKIFISKSILQQVY